MFDFAPVGLVLTVCCLFFVSFAWRILPKRQGESGMGDAVKVAPFSTEVTVKDGLAEGGATISDLKLPANKVGLIALLRGDERRAAPLPDTELHSGDTLILEGEPEALDAVLSHAPLIGASDKRVVERDGPTEEVRAIEAVIQPHSLLIGASARRADLQQRYGVNLLAVSRNRSRIRERLRDISLRAGDVLVLQAGERALPSALVSLGVLPLAERAVLLGGVRRRWAPLIILALAMVLVTIKVLPVALARGLGLKADAFLMAVATEQAAISSPRSGTSAIRLCVAPAATSSGTMPGLACQSRS